MFSFATAFLAAFLLILSLPQCSSEDDEPAQEEDTDNGDSGDEGTSGNSGNGGNGGTGTINGYDYVDLGLGVMWATCNVGADCEEDYGEWFAWGEIESKDLYSSDNSVTYGRDMSDITGREKYDAATANMGDSWRMPTIYEIRKLVTECTWTWTSVNGVSGYEVTGSTGNSIFLPAAGYYSGSSLSSAGSDGYYWCSTPFKGTEKAYCFTFDDEEQELDYITRIHGYVIRAVYGDVDSEAEEGTINSNEYVDLGLTVRWGTCNIGADSPEDYGDYYAWGETETKSSYMSNESVTYGVSMSDFSGNSEYDAATANWGSPWRMPTSSEIDELISDCTWTWTTLNSVNGYEVSGTNGNSIFLPAAGVRQSSSLSGAGSRGFYWSSTPYGSGTYDAYYLSFDSSGVNRGSYRRCYGRSVRPVSE